MGLSRSCYLKGRSIITGMSTIIRRQTDDPFPKRTIVGALNGTVPSRNYPY